MKLSRYVGIVDHRPDLHQEMSSETLEAERAIVEQLRAAFDGHQLDVRGGAFLSDGTWSAAYDEEIEEAPEYWCASCRSSIYFANEQWRHRESGRSEVWDSLPCDKCGGEGRVTVGMRQVRDRPCDKCRVTPGYRQVLNHLADPRTEGRTV